jgi:D-glycero-D-manno-heptose 1,7-bisphosphate phosphatase
MEGVSLMLVMMDVDDTLIVSFMRRGKGGADPVYDLVEVLPGRVEKIRELAIDDHSFALITNQGGVAMGYQNETQVAAKLVRVVDAFDGFHGQPYSVHVCYTHPKATVLKYQADSPLRKPGPGMLLKAMEAHGCDRSEAVFVGDMPTDELAAQAAGVKYVDAEEFFK